MSENYTNLIYKCVWFLDSQTPRTDEATDGNEQNTNQTNK